MKLTILFLPFLALPLLAGGCNSSPARQTPVELPIPRPAPSIAPTDRVEASDPETSAVEAEYATQLNAEDADYAKEETAMLKSEADAEAKLQ